MKERPIIFSGEMVRAILDGRKTQTRRVIKPQPEKQLNYEWRPSRKRYMAAGSEEALGLRLADWCPYGRPGGRLWVRETWLERPDPDPELGGIEIKYRATGGVDPVEFGGWRPSIYMPRWASRITLEITGVRVELVQRIGLGDITAEGIQADLGPAAHSTINDSYVRFIELWDSINAKRGYGWDTNPWVWVLEFRQKED